MINKVMFFQTVSPGSLIQTIMYVTGKSRTAKPTATRSIRADGNP